MLARINTLVLGLAVAGIVTPALAQTSRSPTTATIQNDLRQPITMSVEWGSFDRRIGVVAPMSTATLTLPASVVGFGDVVRLAAHPAAGLDLETQEFHVRPGDHVDMIVPTPEVAYSPVVNVVLPPAELAKTTLTVQNDRAHKVTVYAETDEGMFDRRLGTVNAHSTTTLNFPQAIVAPDEEIQIVIQPARGFELETEPVLYLKRGEHVGLHLTA